MSPGPVSVVGAGDIKVLVVDDNAANLRMMGELLAATGADASFAKLGAQALRLCERARFQLAVLDLNLPDMDGFAVGDGIRRLQPGCEIVFCSAHNNRENRDRAFGEGAIDFIEKPYEMAATRQRLAMHLERLALRANLSQQVAKLDTMVATIPDAVISADRGQRVVGWNAAAERIFGVPVAVALGRPLSDFLPDSPALMPGTPSAGEPAAAGVRLNGSPWAMKAVRADGQPISVEANLSHWSQAGQDYLTLIVRDVSERVRLVEELRLAKDTAERASLAKSEFLANMSHEIRTPMNAILGLTHLALRHATDEKTRDCVERIRRSADHLLAIVNDILDLSKIEADRLSLERIEFSMATVLDRVSELLSEKASAKGLRLVVELDPAVPGRLMGDPLRLRQILINFGDNAVKFADRGEIHVSVRLVGREGDVARVRLAVRDEGIGLSDEQAARLFTDFQQADASTTRKYGGTGLGLSIARRLADLMGGEVGVDSRPGEGATFWCEVPLELPGAPTPTRAADPPGPADAESGPSDVAGSRLLVVDDNDINLMIAEEILRNAGLVVETACNGQQALEKLRDGAYDLVLMDLQMPRMDGLQATRALRGQPGYRATPVVGLTASAMISERDDCLAAGMDDVLTKPYEPEQLLAVVARWLRRAKAGPD
jgi:PAS domain S-box-containing protein